MAQEDIEFQFDFWADWVWMMFGIEEFLIVEEWKWWPNVVDEGNAPRFTYRDYGQSL